MSKEEASLSGSRGAETVDACRDQLTERNKAAGEAEWRVKEEKLRQDHAVALQAKEDELRCKDNIIAELRNKIADLESKNSSLAIEKDQLKIENEILRKEIDERAELQREVYCLNERLNALGPIQRDYDDALDTIARRNAENEVLRGSREKFYGETRQLQGQVAELTCNLNYERENNQIFQNSIRNLGFEIERVTAEKNKWKDKYETEVKKRVENDGLVENRKFRYVVVADTSDNAEQGDTMSGREESFKRQSNMVNVNRAKRPNSEDHYYQPANNSGVSVGASEDQPQPRKKRFELVPCIVPRCKNCDTVFLSEDLMATECSFHRAPPQNYQVWTRLNNQETVRVNPRLKDHMFWPCCESHGRARTKGCMVLKRHEIVYPGD